MVTPNPLWLPVSLLAFGAFVAIARTAWKSRGTPGGKRKRVVLVVLSCACALVGVLCLTVEHIPLAWELTTEYEFRAFHVPDLSAEWPYYVSDVAPWMIWSGCASFVAAAMAAVADRRASETRAV